ncbi:MAG: thioredoxin family protein [Alkalibacterium sp.]
MMNVEVTETNFKELISASQPVLIHFWSDFCGPCKAQSRVLEQLEDKYRTSICIGSINIQDHLDWAEAFSIRSTPTVLIFSKGELSARLTGVHSLSRLENVLSKIEMRS